MVPKQCLSTDRFEATILTNVHNSLLGRGRSRSSEGRGNVPGAPWLKELTEAGLQHRPADSEPSERSPELLLAPGWISQTGSLSQGSL